MMMHRELTLVVVLAAAWSAAVARPQYIPAARPQYVPGPQDSDSDLGEIVFASVVFRHGDRAPEYPYPNDPYVDDVKYWPRGFGQLTSVGEEQHYELGSFLRERYARMLPLTYNHNNTYIRSTDVDRTLVSARCNLAGLYPDKYSTLDRNAIKFQAIPIHTEAVKNDMLLKPYENDNCPRHTTLLAQVKQSREYRCIMKATAEMRREVIKHTGHKEFMADIYDILLVEKLHRFPLPKWTESYFPHPLSYLHLLDSFISLSATTELQKLSAGPLLKKMVEDMVNKIDGELTPDRNLFVYSAHDNNIVNILQSLKVFNGLLVPYASSVLVELRTKSGGYYVTVSYRNGTGEPAHLLKLPECNTLCPIMDFITLVRPVTPDDIEKECQQPVVGMPKQDLQIPPAAIPAEWRHCFRKEGRLRTKK